MRYLPDHVMIIEPIDDDIKLIITSVLNPIYIPKIDETFLYIDFDTDIDGNKTSKVYKFIVVDRKMEIQVVICPEQIVTLKVKRVE